LINHQLFWRFNVKSAVLGCVLAATLAVVPCLASAAVPEVEPGQDFEGIGYSLSSSGEVVIFAGVRNIGGKVAVCGLVWYEKKATATTRSIEAKFTEKVRFAIAGKGLSVSTRTFNRYESREAAQAGNVARCSVTATPWKDAYGTAKLKMKLGAVTIYE
jgi:hypothetical protein